MAYLYSLVGNIECNQIKIPGNWVMAVHHSVKVEGEHSIVEEVCRDIASLQVFSRRMARINVTRIGERKNPLSLFVAG